MAHSTLNSNNLCQIIGYHFNKPALLAEALTHPSSSHRHQAVNYERLEFLGDRVLGLVVADLLFHYHKSDVEGELAKRLAYFASKNFLLDIARQLKLDQYVNVGRGVSAYSEERRQSLLADACEAVIAAIYLDGGLAAAQEFIQYYWMPHITRMKTIPKDAKSSLQEWAQQRGKKPPTYEIIDQHGMDHAPIFTVKVIVDGLTSYQAQAPTRRQAEQMAAALLLKELMHE